METKPLPCPSELVKWLRHMAERGGKGTVDNVDARSLGRVADALERAIPTEGEARDHAEALRSKARILRNDSYGASADVCEKAASYIERTAQGVTPAVVHEVLAMVDGIARDEERQGDDALWTEGYRIMIETCREALAALNPKPEVSK
jgi:hypothetical protein